MTGFARLFACLMILTVTSLSGCGGGTVQDRDRADINVIAKAYRSYAQLHGAPPPNESELRKFIESLPEEKRQALHAENLESIFISPRDRQSYVVSYGETTKGSIPNYYIYEREGVNGKRWAASSMGYVSEVDQGEIDQNVGVKP
jgi:hypothetical protein